MASVPPAERQAFFDLLDEYFASRPHVLEGFTAPHASASHTAPALKKAAAPPPPPRRTPSHEKGAAADVSALPPQMEHMHLAPVSRGPRTPAGLTTTKVRVCVCVLTQSIGSINTTSTGAAVRSMVHHTLGGESESRAPAKADDYYTSPPPAATPATYPAPAATAPAAAAAPAPVGLGTAVALYTYVCLLIQICWQRVWRPACGERRDHHDPRRGVCRLVPCAEPRWGACGDCAHELCQARVARRCPRGAVMCCVPTRAPGRLHVPVRRLGTTWPSAWRPRVVPRGPPARRHDHEQ